MIIKKQNEIVRALSMVTQLGLSMLAPVVLCVWVGTWLDERYGWSTTLALLILGILAGARNTWILVNQVGFLNGMQKGGRNHEKRNQPDSDRAD